MRCKTCDYALWNLRTSACPECGSPFRPSDFDFVPGSIRFLCPHCAQQYYGTSPSGHLVPRSFACVKCAQQIDMDEMLLLPAEGYSEAQTMRATNPWLSPSGSLLGRWWRTVKMSMFQPGQLIEGTPPDSPRRKAWGFALLTQCGLVVVGFSLAVLLMLAGALASGGPGVGAGVGMASAGLAFAVGFMLIVFFLGAFLWAAAAHFILLLGGGTERGFVRTLQCVLYSSGVNVLLVIPCANYLLWIWWVVSCAIMLKQGHRIGGLRASIAAIVAPIVFAVTLVGLYFGFIFMMVTAATAAGARSAAIQAQIAPDDSIVTMTAALVHHAARHDGWPDHAARLLDAGVFPSGFTGPISSTDPADVTAAGTPLNDLMEMTPQERARTIDDIAAGLPADIVAHRVGDFVFTYHGLPIQDPDGRLWIVIESPPPSDLLPTMQILVGRADGATTAFGSAGFPEALESQNEIRAEYDLAPLWHPDFIGEQAPQAGGSGG